MSKTETRIPWWAWVHVLSLEAPLVAVLWQAVLAESHRVKLMPGVVSGLGLVVWLIYVLDRLLDGLGVDLGALNLRHAFYSRNRKPIAFLAVPLMAGMLAWIGLFLIPEGMLWQSLALVLLVVIYLGSYAARQKRRLMGLVGAFVGLGSVLIVIEMPIGPGVKFQLAAVGLLIMTLGFFQRRDVAKKGGFPKELLGGLLFALGCSLGIQFFALGDGAVMLSADTLLLWALFAMNLMGISCVEHAAGVGDAESVPVLWPRVGRLYPWILIVLIVGVSIVALVPIQVPAGTSGLATAVLAALVMHGFIWRFRSRCTPLTFRVLADLALVLPAVSVLAR